MKSNFKRYQSWCEHCDRDYVPNGKKCGYCGNKQYAKSKIKKPNTKEIINKEE
jgi:phage terminase large subunit GpA-like protein